MFSFVCFQFFEMVQLDIPQFHAVFHLLSFTVSPLYIQETDEQKHTGSKAKHINVSGGPRADEKPNLYNFSVNQNIYLIVG